MVQYNLFFLIVSAFLFQTTTSCFFVTKYTVFVVNNLPPNSPPLVLHCASKDDDLGYHTVTTNRQFRFSFCDKPLSTLFFCRFRWNGKDKAFQVFNSSWYQNRCNKNDVCYYAVKSDGFYFSNVYPPVEETFLSTW